MDVPYESCASPISGRAMTELSATCNLAKWNRVRAALLKPWGRKNALRPLAPINLDH